MYLYHRLLTSTCVQTILTKVVSNFTLVKLKLIFDSFFHCKLCSLKGQCCHDCLQSNLPILLCTHNPKVLQLTRFKQNKNKIRTFFFFFLQTYGLWYKSLWLGITAVGCLDSALPQYSLLSRVNTSYIYTSLSSHTKSLHSTPPLIRAMDFTFYFLPVQQQLHLQSSLSE